MGSKIKRMAIPRQRNLSRLIGRKIKEIRKERNMSQFEVAEALGISRVSVTNMEAGRSAFGIERLMEFSELFEVSVDDLIPNKTQYKPTILPIGTKSQIERQKKINNILVKIDRLKEYIKSIDS